MSPTGDRPTCPVRSEAMGDDQHSRSPSRLLAAGLCVFFAAIVAACGLSVRSATPSEVSTAPIGTSAPSTDAAAISTTTPGSAATPVDASTTTVPTSTAPVPIDPTATDAPADPSGTAPISFASTVQPIITETCASCHTGDGPGTQHVRFDTAGDVADTAFAIALVTETRFMPPWPAGADSIPFEHDWSLTDDEIAAIVAWDDAGGPLDVPEDEPMIPANGVIGLDDPDVRVAANGSYDGEFGQPDEYRCFIYDPGVTEPGFVSAIEFIPQQTQVVHHAVGFLVSQQDRAELDRLSGSDGQGGWTCFGFSPGRSADLVFTWAPGTDPTEYPDGTGLEMQPGDFFVLQTHYHYDVEAPADQSEMAFDFVDRSQVATTDSVNLFTYLAPAEIPCGPGEEGPLCDRNAARQKAIDAYGPEGVLADALIGGCGNPLDAPDGFVDGVARSVCDWPVLNPGEIVSVFGHEHEIGASFRMTLNPDTPDEVVLLDIPTWDFNWQFIYEPVDSIVIERSDTIRIECTWDRALRDPELEPAYVLWADGTDDEMCFSSLVTRPA